MYHSASLYNIVTQFKKTVNQFAEIILITNGMAWLFIIVTRSPRIKATLLNKFKSNVSDPDTMVPAPT